VTVNAFTNRYTRVLPGEIPTGTDPRQVYHAAYSRVLPTAVRAPSLLAFNPALAKQIGFSDLVDIHDHPLLARILAGNQLLAGMDPYAMAYGGHQFGHWAGQLGDGRAINLGEIRNQHGQYWTLQLKGAGPTPYSRHADGRAVLRSSLREYLCSEAMYALGVPTTRALSLVLTGESVIRDMFYDGNPQAEPGAIVCRVAPSFIRFGSFELPAARGDIDLLGQLFEFVISTDRPELLARLKADPGARADICLQWFAEVCQSTMQMVVEWMRVGFVHGVMNTDNMSVLGLTIDYGPYGWTDNYDPDWTPNTTDAHQRRYRFGQQGAIARWNLYQLANAIYPLVQDADALQAIVDGLQQDYNNRYHQMMCRKLGLDAQNPQTHALIAELEQLLVLKPTDMTLFFRKLSGFDPDSPSCTLLECVEQAFYEDMAAADVQSAWRHWEQQYRTVLQVDSNHQARRTLMDKVNPAYVPRNYLSQMAIDAVLAGDMEPLEALLSVLSKPYDSQPQAESRFGARRPDWALNKPGCSMLSCSS
jgi:serine/tyrosine/threonine adenylyltransferase